MRIITVYSVVLEA